MYPCVPDVVQTSLYSQPPHFHTRPNSSGVSVEPSNVEPTANAVVTLYTCITSEFSTTTKMTVSCGVLCRAQSTHTHTCCTASVVLMSIQHHKPQRLLYWRKNISSTVHTNTHTRARALYTAVYHRKRYNTLLLLLFYHIRVSCTSSERRDGNFRRKTYSYQLSQAVLYAVLLLRSYRYFSTGNVYSSTIPSLGLRPSGGRNDYLVQQ